MAATWALLGNGGGAAPIGSWLQPLSLAESQGGWVGAAQGQGWILGKPLVVSPSLRLQLPLWGQRAPGTRSLGAWKSPPGFPSLVPQAPLQGSGQGGEGQGSGSDFPKEGTSPAVCIFGPLLEAPRVQGFIPPALWLLWWEDRFPDTPYRFLLHSLEAVPTC